MAEPVALAALALEAAIGWPEPVYRCVGHPVGGFARAIGWCERRWNVSQVPALRPRMLGIVTLLLVLAVGIGAALAVEAIARTLFGRWAWLAIVAAAVPGLAQHSLYVHVAPVARALRAGDLATARARVGMIVGRDTDGLDAPGVARAAIESLAESFCDGVVAPLFWLLLLGLPGLWGYKAINTADSLIGHREPRWRAFGWAGARSDDLANLLPARLSGILICLAGIGGWRTMARDARRHASPNAGWPEAAMAGVLGLRLAGPVAYDGLVQPKPWIGDGRAEANEGDVDRALAVYRRACLLLWLIAGVFAWAR